MTKKSLILSALLLAGSYAAEAQRKCGIEYTRASLIEYNPAWEQRIEDQRSSLQGLADAYIARKKTTGLAKTTSASAIPVIFHVLVTFDQYMAMGGNPGIAQRVDSQIAVLNRDFNAQNADSAQIPSGWKHLFASTGIHFGLAHTDPLGFGSTGYEIKIIPDAAAGFDSARNNYRKAKHNSTNGFDSWDVTKYINVWCFNPTDVPGLLGSTVSKSQTAGSGSGSVYPVDEEGICINYLALGKRSSPADNYIATTYMSDYYDEGRTLTHEMGHFFEIWHTWGDDNVYCPWSGPHKDDGIADTPPEGGPKFFNYPNTIPGGTYYDTCRYFGTPAVDTQSVLFGVGSLDFMNYTDDTAMHLFTTLQAAAMASMVDLGGENYSLTQHPELLLYSSKTSVDDLANTLHFQVSPIPSTGLISVNFNGQTGSLKAISVSNVVGEVVYLQSVTDGSKEYYSIDLSALSKGIYFVRCNFAFGIVTRKILLQ